MEISNHVFAHQLGLTDLLSRVQPEMVAAYLTNVGWEKRRVLARGASLWYFPKARNGEEGEDYEVLLPESSQFADYLTRVEDLLLVLARVERRSQSEILADLTAEDQTPPRKIPATVAG
jgi:hypothetical protein